MKKWVYYNDNDKFVVQWLHQLMKEGCIPDGEIDSRSITEVVDSDLRGFDQCHFFSGISGWSYALELAGWGDRPVWTGSCPCQPFSSAGLRAGVNDERHLWPEFRRLIEECQPPTVFGEQVESKDGRVWLSGVRADLEALDYAFGAADLCAASIGAPHIRQRLWWVAHTDEGQRGRLSDRPGSKFNGTAAGWVEGDGFAEPGRANGRLAISQVEQHDGSGHTGQRRGEFANGSGLGNADSTRPQGRCEHLGEHTDQRAPWASGQFIECTDGKSRRIEPGIFPLASGFSNRVGVLRGSGNSIVPQVAAEFISAFLDIEEGLS